MSAGPPAQDQYETGTPIHVSLLIDQYEMGKPQVFLLTYMRGQTTSLPIHLYERGPTSFPINLYETSTSISLPIDLYEADISSSLPIYLTEKMSIKKLIFPLLLLTIENLVQHSTIQLFLMNLLL